MGLALATALRSCALPQHTAWFNLHSPADWGRGAASHRLKGCSSSLGPSGPEGVCCGPPYLPICHDCKIPQVFGLRQNSVQNEASMAMVFLCS